MANASSIHGNLLIFDGNNYDDWFVKMKVIIGFQEIDEVVQIEFQESPNNASEEQKEVYRENKRLDYKA
uniref:DUF4219 domain-containing protein n=1 Tax=Cajanus cajan TaxID=3821 RepID=A0A151TDF5_CAJCA|nr:hypothetical protein KK1_019708 [Cajanus cajan]